MIKSRVSLICFFVGFSLVQQAQALQEPSSSEYDSRLKSVSYNPDDVVKVDSVLGVQTHIIIDPSEKYITHAWGDPDAWSFSHKLNHYFIKPKDAMSDTNLTIVTDKREYNFDVRFYDEPYDKKGKTSFDKRMTFRIKFRYPEIEAAIARKKAEQERLEKQTKEVRRVGYNINYSMNGDVSSIAPMNVWDDGIFTYIKFGPGQEIPVVFYVGDDGEESIVGQHSAGANKEIVVMHRVGGKWYLRLGKKVVGLYNNSVKRVEADSGAYSPSVEREIIK